MVETLVFAMLHATYGLIIFVSLYLIFSFFESLFPAEKNQPAEAKIQNLKITSVYLVFGTLLYSFLIQSLPLTIPDASYTSVVGQIVFTIIAIFTGDIFFYLYHRLEHTWKYLWTIHELHHSDTYLNVTTSYRTYFLEMPLQALLISIPASLIYGNLATNFMYILVIKLLWEFFTHANLRIHLYKLTPVFTGPQLHRIHHSIEDKHQDKNFAQYFPVLDIIFGTYYRPEKDEYPKTGTKNMPSNISVSKMLIKPFTEWYRFIFRN